MLTYLYLKSEDFDYEEFFDYILIPIVIILDLFFILFQPIFYLIYKYKRNDENEL
jgi:hypothetical protein